MKLQLFGLIILIVGLSLLALPALAQEEARPPWPTDPVPPEPRAPAFTWLPVVSAQTQFAALHPPPEMPERPEAAMPEPDKPVRPPTVFLPMVGGGL